MVVELTDSNFDDILQKADVPIVVDFYAEWCRPCIDIIGPAMDQMAKDYEGKAIIAKVNVDHNPKVCLEHSIRNIPVILYFKHGKQVDKQVGATSKSALSKKLEASF